MRWSGVGTNGRTVSRAPDGASGGAAARDAPGRRLAAVERVDVVVVGARLAGCAVAAPLARAGRRVVVLDRMVFPSDQLSTHVLMPAGTSELAKLGALPRILELKPVAGVLGAHRGRWHQLAGAAAAGGGRHRLRRVRTARPAGRATGAGGARAGRGRARALHGAVAALARRARRRRGLPRRRRRRARDRLHAARRRRRSALDGRRAGGRVDALPDLAQRSRPGLPLSRGPADGWDRDRDLLPVARRRLVRVRLSEHACGRCWFCSWVTATR